jgi:diguanylate cyclase (GGDEF)-like protein/PAS domain S-box-containing protein
MKTIRTFRLGRWLPVVLLAWMGVFWGGLSLVEYRLWEDRIYSHGAAEVREELARLQRAMGQQLLKANRGAAEQALTWAAARPPFAALATLDDAGTVLLASQLAWKGREAGQVLLNFDPADFAALRGKSAPIVHPSGDGGRIVGYAPIDIGEEGALRSLRQGAIFIDYDLRFERAEFWRGLLHKSAVFGIASLFMAGLMLWLLRKLVTEPLERLAEAARRIEAGESGSDSGLVGPGELADLGRAFDRMSRTLLRNLEALRERERNLNITLRSIGDGVVATDREGRIQRINAVGEILTGWPESEASGRPIGEVFRIVDGRSREPADNPVARVFVTRAPVELGNNIVLISRDGQECQIADSAAPILDEHGEMQGAVLVFRDVTPEYRFREALKFKQYGIDHTLDSILWMNAEGRLLDVNRGACRMLGYDRDELLKMALGDIDPNRTATSWARHWAELREHFHATFETVHRRKDGQLMPVEVTDNYLVYEGREYNCAVVRDLTDRRRMEQALRAESLRNALLLKTASDGIHILDETGRVVQASDAFCRMLGYAREDVIGMHAADWDAQWTHREIDARIRAPLDGSAVFETRHRRRDGSVFDAEVSVTSVVIGDQRLLYCASRDISERKAAERALRESEARFRELSDAAPVLIWMSGLDKTCDYFNRGWLEFTGRTLAEEQGDGWAEGVHPDDKARCLETYARSFDAREPFRMEYRLRRHDGEYRWLLDTGRPRFDGQGDFLGFIGSCIDITEMKQAELELRLAASAFETNEAIVITDAAGVIQRANQAYCRTTGYSREEAIGRKPSIAKSGLHDKAFYRALWRTLLRDGFWQGEVWNRRKSGEIYPEWLSITAVKDKDGGITHYVGSFIDISRQKAAEEQIRQLAYYDTLTGLPNRRLLYDRLQRIFTAAARFNQYGALLFIDVDNFKMLNDTAGHDVGDQLLVQLGERLSRIVRAEDIVARLGGDEFVIVLQHLGADELDAATRAEQVARKIITATSEPRMLAGREHHITLSIGVALFRGDEERPESFLKRADAAMYQAKAAGRNTVCFFDPKMAAAMEARIALLAELHKAYAAGQFHLHCQPLVDDGGRFAGGEILLRWEHPERGWIEPSEFIPLAEESGLITEIGTWVLDGTCDLIRRWEDAGWLAPDFFLAVNISPRQFRQPDFAEIVRAAVARAGVAARRLKLEITEGVLISKLDDTAATLSDLRAAGVRFSLDDFGTGYSSLSYLQRLPLDQIKIDRSFVRNLSEDANDAAIVKAIISMGHSLGLEVVAEGVETRAQFEFLKEHGCHLFQGYLFGQPVETESLERDLRAALAGGAGFLPPAISNSHNPFSQSEASHVGL